MDSAGRNIFFERLKACLVQSIFCVKFFGGSLFAGATYTLALVWGLSELDCFPALIGRIVWLGLGRMFQRSGRTYTLPRLCSLKAVDEVLRALYV